MLGIPDNDNDVGDDEDPAASGATDVGSPTRQLIAGDGFTCALREDSKVVCWGGYSHGQLGYGSEETVGDNETPAQQGTVMLGEDVSELSSGASARGHSCVLLDSGNVRCWGWNVYGELGLGHLDDVGDNETPDSQDPVQILD